MPPTLTVKTGDILDEPADVLVCSANGQLRMTGGVNLAIFTRPGGEAVERELQEHLSRSGRAWVPPGTVVATGPGPLAVRYILHAVAIDPVYKTSVDLVRDTISAALRKAAELGARTVALTALATGYGRMSPEDFGEALRQAAASPFPPVAEVRVVVRKDSEAEAIRRRLGE
jgi:O-acetyl-ADP-ribose deacetylase (regulator of RNase III)